MSTPTLLEEQLKQIWYSLFCIYVTIEFCQGQFDAAISDFDVAIREDPKNENAKMYRKKTIERKYSGNKERTKREFLLNWTEEQKRLQKYKK